MGDEIQLSMASLESRTDYGDEQDGYSHVVMKTTKSEYLLCTLVHGLTFQQNLDLKLRPKETVTFSVQGSNVVYLMGYTVTDSEVEDQIDIEEEVMDEVDEDAMNEMVDFDEDPAALPVSGDIEEEETPRDHNEPDEDEGSVGMAEVEMSRHRQQLESRDVNPPGTSGSEVQIEINRPDEFSTEESLSVNIKVEEALEPEEEEEPESNIIPSTLAGGTIPEAPEDVVPTGIQRNQTIQGHSMHPQSVAGPQSSWTNASFQTHRSQPQPVVRDVGSISSQQTGGGKVIARACNVTARKHVTTSQQTNCDPSTARRSGNIPSGEHLLTQLFAKGNPPKDSTKSYPVSCPFCRITIRGSGQFQVHLRSHTGEKPFKCSVCEKSFSQVQNRDRHERTHTGARPFRCHFCDRTFTQNHHRKKHEVQSHGELWTIPDN